MSMKDIEQRIAAFAFSSVSEIAIWLSKFPHLTVDQRGKDELIVTHSDGFTCGVVAMQPLDMGLQLVFAVFGPNWALLGVNVLPIIKAELKRRAAKNDAA